jgi:hypothetical protein
MLTTRALTLVFVAAASLAVAAGCSKNAAPPAAAASTPVSQAVATAPPPATQAAMFIAADLPLLPPGIVNGAAPVEVTKAVYEFAARHPEVLQHVPCFCGCERGGHKGNHDCFVASRDQASGQVKSWDSHGITCEICIDVGARAMQMHNAGASVVEIRDAIDKRYAAATNRTPTPHPPRGGHQH